MTYSKNDIEEKIFAFLDGELNDSEEAQLLALLSKDHSARSMFKFHFKLADIKQQFKSSIVLPQNEDDKISRLLAKMKPAIKTQRVEKVYFWQQKFSLTPLWAMAACILIVIGTLTFSKILPSTRLQKYHLVRIENIDEIHTIRKHIPKVKLTIEDRVDLRK